MTLEPALEEVGVVGLHVDQCNRWGLRLPERSWRQESVVLFNQSVAMKVIKETVVRKTSKCGELAPGAAGRAQLGVSP